MGHGSQGKNVNRIARESGATFVQGKVHPKGRVRSYNQIAVIRVEERIIG